MIPIYKPYLPKKTLVYAHDAIDSTWISSQGKYIEEATEKLKSILNVKYVQLLNNGTSATHMAVKALLYKNPNIKKVIVPNNVYVAAWNAFLYEGIKLIPIDSSLDTWNIDINKLPDALDQDTAICLVNNLGNTIDTPYLVEKYGKNFIIEDNCEGFMGSHGSLKSGTASLASSLSFFGNKNITSGEGGALITDDIEIYNFINSSQGQGQKKEERYVHDKLGYNYRMTNIQAAILLGQMEVLPEIIEKKNKIFDTYREKFGNMPKIKIQKIKKNTKHSNWMMGIRIVGNKNYKKIHDFLLNCEIDTRPMFFPMSKHKHLKLYANLKEEKVSSLLSKECVLIPSFPELKDLEINKIINAVYKYTKNI
tara:strand:- start:84 stop:1181 length:1098 start_codon:yes stop_codon:yes gene_type:complete